MYLKSMELHGFKSFANKIKLDFHDGITGIVGPNGSGKSNVADAVRWVLGEQSAKQLRGGNMQDVIFSGTENRKPLGFASVAITLDNRDRILNFDANEITVTRKLYRSGESDYQLNGRSCRLKDINELFYDTGIGKEGYSIIGQGQIDQILNGRPEERRELFDEAAGIVKFKRRKIASLKKLDQEQSNLVRVRDILSELTRQVVPLESQAKKAEEYLRKRDSLRELDAGLFLLESRKTEEDREELAQKQRIAEAHVREIELALARTRQEYDHIEVELGELDEKIQDTREDMQNSLVQKQSAEGQINVLREQIISTETNTRLVQERIASIEEDRRRRQDQVRDQEKRKSELQMTLSEVRQKREDKERALREVQEEIRRSEAGEEECRARAIDLLNERSSIREKLQRYDTMQEQIEIRKSELSARMLQAKGDETREKERLDQLEKEREETDREAGELTRSLEETGRRLAEIRETVANCKAKFEAGQAEYHRKASRLESLQNITERYEGYGNSIRKVMEQKSSNPGIHGVVADLIKTDQKYELAIETALGGSLQNIVTDNEATAKYLIDYLKRGRLGRATFLPLTAVREDSGSVSGQVLKETGVVGLARDLVEAEPIYRGVVNRLLAKTVVVDSIDHAILVGRKYHQSVRMVTLEGDLLSPGGSMTGGSFKFKNNLLGRRREIEELELEVGELGRRQDKLRLRLEDLRGEREDLRERQTDLNDRLQKLRIRQNSLGLTLQVSREKSLSLRDDYSTLTRERGTIDEQIGELSDKRARLQETLEDSRAREQELERELGVISDRLDGIRSEEGACQTSLEAIRLEHSNLDQEFRFLEEKIRDLRAEIDRGEEERQTLERNLTSEDGGISDKQKKIDQLRQSIEDLDTIGRQCADTIQNYLDEKEKLSRDHKSFFARRDELAEEKTSMDQECFRLQSRLEKLEESMDNLIAYLFEEYQITPDQAESYVREAREDRAELRREIAALKSEIRGLGTVNVNAIEEYKELKERHDFLRGQHDDLVQATESLQKIIEELERGMRKQFKEKFSQIREEFDRVFRELFGGGKGSLELAEGEDILESGISIISQPPGKKLQNMMQLSGGEKALTAIALLFAIQNLKPSPFCLLDEIEAALDDSNVTRFAQYLHKLTKNTQFIIITHRRGTMNAADRLYGITMQEKGVSTLVSVDLIEAELDGQEAKHG